MQKLNEIQRYKPIADGQSVTFMHPEGQALESRLIKMRLNVPAPVNLYITRLDTVEVATGEIVEDELRFLAHVSAGHDQIEFHYRGSFALKAVGGEIWLDTFDSTEWEVPATDFSSYARVWEREERDPRILEIEQAARHNQRLLADQMAADRAERDALMAEMRKLREANVATSATPPAATTASPTTGVATVGAESDQGTAAAPKTGASGKSDDKS